MQNIDRAPTKPFRLKVGVNLVFTRPFRIGSSYDESTLKKINQACDALHNVTELIRQKSSSRGEDGINIKAGSQKILAELMDELPREAADEFLYDSTIHRLHEVSIMPNSTQLFCFFAYCLLLHCLLGLT
jgi:hypothetical protein